MSKNTPQARIHALTAWHSMMKKYGSSRIWRSSATGTSGKHVFASTLKSRKKSTHEKAY